MQRNEEHNRLTSGELLSNDLALSVARFSEASFSLIEGARAQRGGGADGGGKCGGATGVGGGDNSGGGGRETKVGGGGQQWGGVNL